MESSKGTAIRYVIVPFAVGLSGGGALDSLFVCFKGLALLCGGQALPVFPHHGRPPFRHSLAVIIVYTKYWCMSIDAIAKLYTKFLCILYIDFLCTL